MQDSNIFSVIWLRSADLFDRVQYLFNGNFWESLKNRFQKYFVGSVLDLACGTGELIKYIEPREYLGIDINADYIERATRLYKKKHVDFRIDDITDFQIKQKFETIAFIGAAHHLSNDQLRQLCQSVVRLLPDKFLVIDGLPIGPFAPILRFLDAKLGGGKYFRDEDEIGGILQNYFQIVEKGKFKARHSFYIYPYLVATVINP